MIGGTRVDYWRDALIKRAFVGGGECVAVAGQQSAVQLWNPAASGKLLIVNRIRANMDVAGTMYLAYYATALSASLTSKGNKYLGEATSIGLIRYEANAGVLGTIIDRIYLPATSMFMEIFDVNIIIGEGMGLSVTHLTANRRITADFEWIEA